MDLSIIIVNWNSKHFLDKCIKSILATATGFNFEIIVIDSGSFDGCGEMLRQRYPQVRFLQNNQNLGFAKANNEAFRKSTGRYLLFLNPDTEVKREAVRELLHELEVLPDAGAVGAKLLNTDKTIQTSCIRSFPDIQNQILDSEILRNCFPRSRLWGMAPLFAQSEKPIKVDAVSGACLMIKKSVFENIGMFSTEYFMYSEDIDLCFKLQHQGWNTYYVPKAAVIHHGGGSSLQESTNTFSDVMILESRWRFFRKTRSHEYSQLYRIAMLSMSIIRIWLLSISLPILGMRGKTDSTIMALRKWIARLRWALGFEKWVKNY